MPTPESSAAQTPHEAALDALGIDRERHQETVDELVKRNESSTAACRCCGAKWPCPMAGLYPHRKDTRRVIEAADRFTCRREGHTPTLRVTRQNTTSEKGATYVTSCARCGEVYEEAMPDVS